TSYYIISDYSHRCLASRTTQEFNYFHTDSVCISQILKCFNLFTPGMGVNLWGVIIIWCVRCGV
ncbi:MAG: hypothetical protein KJ976_03345, partial [Proteobacteria bacterium]|nr:hypothetical protein [Pseudomonadota bacterium]